MSPDPGTVGVTDEGVVIREKQLLPLSSSPEGQSLCPSHSFVEDTHVPSLQANWSGPQVTVTHRHVMVRRRGTISVEIG